MQKVCILCLEPSKLKCSRCLTIQYCCKECQKKDWKVHKNNCQDNTNTKDLIDLHNKAVSYQKQGNNAKAEKLFKELLKHSYTVYGEKHDNTISTILIVDTINYKL